VVKKIIKTSRFLRNTFWSSTPLMKVIYVWILICWVSLPIVCIAFVTGMLQKSVSAVFTKETQDVELRPRKEKYFKVPKDAIQPLFQNNDEVEMLKSGALPENYRNESRSRCSALNTSWMNKKNYTIWDDGNTENGEDRSVRDYFRGDKYGRYIEVGLQKQEPMSSTWLLEWCLRWEGLRIDAVKEKLMISEKYRPNAVHYNIGISDVETQNCFHIDNKDKLHRVPLEKSLQYVIPCVTLQRLLKERGWNHIDFLSVSTKGDELKVLQSVDFSQTKIQLLMIVKSENENEIYNMLKSRGYKRILDLKDYNVFSAEGASFASVNRNLEKDTHIALEKEI